MHLYMMVTNDKYELPLAVADSIEELAMMTGKSRNTIASALSHQKKTGHKSIYIKIECDNKESNRKGEKNKWN